MQLFFLQGHLHLLKLALFTNIFSTTSWDVLLSPSTEFLSRGVADIMSFYDSNERQPKEIIAGINARTFWGDKMTVTLVTLEPNVILLSRPTHTNKPAMSWKAKLSSRSVSKHRFLDQEIYIIHGNAEHSVNVGDLPTRLFETFAPVREDLKY